MFLAYLERLVRDLDKKVDRGKDRLRRSAQAKQQVCIRLLPFVQGGSDYCVHLFSLFMVMDQGVIN